MRKLALVAIGWIFAIASWAQSPAPSNTNALQAIPTLASRVIDQTQTLSDSEIAGLQAQLKAIEDKRGSQIVVLMVASTQPEDIFSYSNRVANAWKIGRKDVGDGILVVIAKNDRKLRIEIAKSLEGAIPDLAASDIITNAITPAFKLGQYAQGLQAGIAQIEARTSAGTYAPKVSDAYREDTYFGLGDNFPFILIILILLLISFKFFGVTNTLIVLMGQGRSISSGSGSGGGFSSGGGGNFGGGGASGDW
jgi:uncharacterized protein